MSDELIVKVEGLSKRYGDIVAVNGVSFSVKRGEIFGILGPNGAGKTTTLEILEGLTAPDAGSVEVVGYDVVKSPSQVKANIGIQLQNSAYFTKLKLSEMLRLYGRLYGLQVDAMELLKLVNLEARAGAYFDKLSGGQKQRFSIAVGLVNKPALIFLDEPTTGLDPAARRSLWALIRSLNESGQTIIMTTHYMEEAEELCDRVGVMNQGEFVALDTAESMIEALVARGFKSKRQVRAATLEDVFIDLTGSALNE